MIECIRIVVYTLYVYRRSLHEADGAKVKIDVVGGWQG